MTNYWKNMAICFAIIGAVIFSIIFALDYNGGRLNKKIGELTQKNKLLEERNAELIKNISVIQKRIEINNRKLDTLFLRESYLIRNYLFVEREIVNLKKKYEKADTFSRNYNADSVRWYFSTFKERYSMPAY